MRKPQKRNWGFGWLGSDHIRTSNSSASGNDSIHVHVLRTYKYPPVGVSGINFTVHNYFQPERLGKPQRFNSISVPYWNVSNNNMSWRWWYDTALLLRYNKYTNFPHSTKHLFYGVWQRAREICPQSHLQVFWANELIRWWWYCNMDYIYICMHFRKIILPPPHSIFIFNAIVELWVSEWVRWTDENFFLCSSN